MLEIVLLTPEQGQDAETYQRFLATVRFALTFNTSGTHILSGCSRSALRQDDPNRAFSQWNPLGMGCIRNAPARSFSLSNCCSGR